MGDPDAWGHTDMEPFGARARVPEHFKVSPRVLVGGGTRGFPGVTIL